MPEWVTYDRIEGKRVEAEFLAASTEIESVSGTLGLDGTAEPLMVARVPGLPEFPETVADMEYQFQLSTNNDFSGGVGFLHVHWADGRELHVHADLAKSAGRFFAMLHEFGDRIGFTPAPKGAIPHPLLILEVDSQDATLLSIIDAEAEVKEYWRQKGGRDGASS